MFVYLGKGGNLTVSLCVCVVLSQDICSKASARCLQGQQQHRGSKDVGETDGGGTEYTGSDSETGNAHTHTHTLSKL